ncbi:hypothetical protein M422DRAFT_779254 [Sphaerobolus stellatus SS14]|uniref:Unplaced genomic scaffold SPHSTscaffold_40, whole genome shotgun sequence n=1 Tax=Sphaerobolus stellatus (strain SS14) TaxID=990650 RepID=A0A0C9VCU4_SPHS4|nr:hypothetical protein M422DRAFT_779254 [Sphaerobolus stellatus SS14]
MRPISSRWYKTPRHSRIVFTKTYLFPYSSVFIFHSRFLVYLLSLVYSLKLIMTLRAGRDYIISEDGSYAYAAPKEDWRRHLKSPPRPTGRTVAPKDVFPDYNKVVTQNGWTHLIDHTRHDRDTPRSSSSARYHGNDSDSDEEILASPSDRSAYRAATRSARAPAPYSKDLSRATRYPTLIHSSSTASSSSVPTSDFNAFTYPVGRTIYSNTTRSVTGPCAPGSKRPIARPSIAFLVSTFPVDLVPHRRVFPPASQCHAQNAIWAAMRPRLTPAFLQHFLNYVHPGIEHANDIEPPTVPAYAMNAPQCPYVDPRTGERCTFIHKKKVRKTLRSRLAPAPCDNWGMLRHYVVQHAIAEVKEQLLGTMGLFQGSIVADIHSFKTWGAGLFGCHLCWSLHECAEELDKHLRDVHVEDSVKMHPSMPPPVQQKDEATAYLEEIGDYDVGQGWLFE